MLKNKVSFKLCVCLTVFTFMFSSIPICIVILPVMGQKNYHPDLKKAIQDFQDGSYEKAASSIESLIKIKAKELSNPDLIVAYEYLARSRYKIGNFDAAKEAYIELLKLKPDHEFDPDYVPPKQTSYFTEVKGEVLASVTIRSNPTNAKVVWDENPCEGETPLTLDNVIVGEHKLRIEKELYIPCDTLVFVSAGKTNEFNIELTPIQAEVKVSKPLYKKWWIWGLTGVLIGAVVLAIGGDNGTPGPTALPEPPPPPGN